MAIVSEILQNLPKYGGKPKLPSAIHMQVTSFLSACCPIETFFEQNYSTIRFNPLSDSWFQACDNKAIKHFAEINLILFLTNWLIPNDTK